MLSQLQRAPEGFHSVCGTESDQQVPPVKHFAKFGDRMAKTLLAKGDVYGKQFIIFESYQAYPMYVVTYTCPDDFKPWLTSPPRTQVADVVECLRVCIHKSPVYTISYSVFPLQSPKQWEHKAWSEKSWTEYSPKHNMRLSQAIVCISVCDMHLFILN